MRDLVRSKTYRLRKALDDFLFKMFPKTWIPLYNSVSFTHMPYSECVKNREWQNKVSFRHLNHFKLTAIFQQFIFMLLFYFYSLFSSYQGWFFSVLLQFAFQPFHLPSLFQPTFYRNFLFGPAESMCLNWFPIDLCVYVDIRHYTVYLLYLILEQWLKYVCNIILKHFLYPQKVILNKTNRNIFKKINVVQFNLTNGDKKSFGIQRHL